MGVSNSPAPFKNTNGSENYVLFPCKKLFLEERISCMHFKYLKHNGLILIKIMAVGKSVSLAPKTRNDLVSLDKHLLCVLFV